MTFQNVRLERRGSAHVLTIDRPKALNSLDHATLAELAAAVREADAAAGTGAIVVTGAGEKAFVAGADISEMASMGPLAAREHALRGQAALATLADATKPTIAAINGYALGGGLELALACDLRIASENAVLGLPETGLAVIPGFGGTQRLPRVVGAARAAQLVLTGERIPAAKALEWGLVSAVLPREKLLDEALRLSDAISANGPYAVRLAKRVIREGMDMPLSQALSHEASAFGLCFGTRDQKEGMTAFLEKRKPGYEGN